MNSGKNNIFPIFISIISLAMLLLSKRAEA